MGYDISAPTLLLLSLLVFEGVELAQQRPLQQQQQLLLTPRKNRTEQTADSSVSIYR
jgi:hypothetical protein